jgi:predicted DNA-binding transcriptional regulator AlpA
MSRPRRSITCPRDPIGLSAEEAAAYIGVSATTFLTAVEKDMLPQPHQLFSRMIWDADELRTALRNLPRKNGSATNVVGDVDWDDVA